MRERHRGADHCLTRGIAVPAERLHQVDRKLGARGAIHKLVDFGCKDSAGDRVSWRPDDSGLCGSCSQGNRARSVRNGYSTGADEHPTSSTIKRWSSIVQTHSSVTTGRLRLMLQRRRRAAASPRSTAVDKRPPEIVTRARELLAAQPGEVRVTERVLATRLRIGEP